MITLSSETLLKKRYDPLSVEKWVMDFWDRNKIYEKIKNLLCREQKKLFRFLEGPPTTNGFMHVGHARGRTFKDVMLRYMRMKGYCVWDQAGWDTQGLPVELEVERNLRIKTKKDIEIYGIENFVKECQKIVDYYINSWRRASIRLGLWLDYDNAYETRNPRYIEAVWHFLKSMWNKGYLYEDLRVVPVCPRCETALSSHEVAQGYRTIKDPSLYFKVPLQEEQNTYLIAWTTTPWTIISNEAIAVHPTEVYVKIKVGNEYWILAEKRLENFIKTVNIEKYDIVEAFPGSYLYNKKYIHPLADEVPKHREHEPINHRILVAEWVSMDEGTGVVHIAPAHGPEDFELGKRHGLILFRPIQKNGIFTEEAGKYSGKWFKEVNPMIISDLMRKNLVVFIDEIEHEYPHCWRCETPLMYFADRQWFIKIEPIKDVMIKENNLVKWYPDWAGKRFADWINSARDWCISRERYWGTPLPIWTCTSCGNRIAIGSIDELKQYALNIEELYDIHRPWIDRIKLRCPKCGNIMVREPFVVDVWLDSGMAHTASLKQIAQEENFNVLFPYDWITEAIDQTRGWFYTLLFTSVALYNSTPYRSVLCQGHVLDKFGKKMSKSRGNVIWALDFMDKNGADILRLYLLSKAAPWDNINFDPDEARDIRKILDILWNSVNFAITYMDLDKWNASNIDKDLQGLLPEDYWILYELNRLIVSVDAAILSGDLHIAVRNILNFITEILSHKYITVIRPRVWLEEDSSEKRSAYAVLYIVLTTLFKILAPFAPFISEYLYQAFTKRYTPKDAIKESIHMENWPTVDESLLNEAIWNSVEEIFDFAEKILRIRAEKGIKRRWPIKRVVIVLNDTKKASLYSKASRILMIYSNVKNVEITTDIPRNIDQNMILIMDKSAKLYVDLTIDEELLMEGLARDLIRRIQMLRKNLNLPVDYTIRRLYIYSNTQVIQEMLKKFKNYIEKETRVAEISIVSNESIPGEKYEWDIDEYKVAVSIEL